MAEYAIINHRRHGFPLLGLMFCGGKGSVILLRRTDSPDVYEVLGRYDPSMPFIEAVQEARRYAK